MAMTRRDYQQIADTIRYARIEEGAKWELAQDLAHLFGAMNSRFDRGKFVAAAMPEKKGAK